jgi:hypothetical protein
MSGGGGGGGHAAGGGLPKLLILWVVDCPNTQECRGIARSGMQDLLRLILLCFGFSYFLLLLYHDLACPSCMSLVFSTE